MRKRLSYDPILCEKLVPGYALGCRRMTPGAAYLESLTQANVMPVLKSAIRITPDGVVDSDGVEYKVDIVVCATGFDTLLAPHFTVIGRDSRNIREDWKDIPKGYLSIMAEGYPNLYCEKSPARAGPSLLPAKSYLQCSWDQMGPSATAQPYQPSSGTPVTFSRWCERCRQKISRPSTPRRRQWKTSSTTPTN
jgi:cation diffusion facilitator CzcD-associated flavoprotein CzcO